MMEKPSKYDFFLRFKALFGKNGNFVDYILVSISDNFHSVTNINTEHILGKKISEIVLEYESDLFGIEDIYYNMIPKTIKKYEKRIDGLNRLYLISIFSDDRDYLVIFYNDISNIRKFRGKNILDWKKNIGQVYDFQGKQSDSVYRDKLTGLYNREFFEEELRRLDSPRQLPASVIMGDLNGLKLINDAFGHDIGDKALKRVAQLMKNAFRKEDIISRVGGDEFVILLPKTSEKTALSIVKRIKEQCIANPLDFITISISFGVATKINEEENIFEAYKKAEDKMYFSKLKESKEAKISMINYLKDKLEEISCETKAHYGRLNDICLMLADKLGLSDREKEELRLLCEFHDIGKIGVSSYIWGKEEPLSEDEWEKIKRHSEIGYYIIGSSREILAIDELVLLHHERWDGKGYPGLLKRDDIPMTVRIFAIADAYEAMVNDRPYKSRISNKQALKEIESKAGTQFDPYLAKTFIQMMTDSEVAV